MKISYADGEILRKAVRARVAATVRVPELRLDGVTDTARAVVRTWPRPPRVVDWDWHRVTKRKAGADIDLSIWHGETLCGLAYGRCLPRWLELGWLEGNPHGHPLRGRIMDLALAVLVTQAAALDLAETRLKNPLEELHGAYRRRGWAELAEVDGAVYLYRTRPQQ